MDRLKFMLDTNCNTLWSVNKSAVDKFGYNIEDLASLGLTNKTININNIIRDVYTTYLNPIYQGLPSFWSTELYIIFSKVLNILYLKIMHEIGEKYEIENIEKEYFFNSEKISIEQNKLQSFINDPITYYNNLGISSSNNLDKERTEVLSELNKWKEIESKIVVKLHLLIATS